MVIYVHMYTVVTLSRTLLYIELQILNLVILPGLHGLCVYEVSSLSCMLLLSCYILDLRFGVRYIYIYIYMENFVTEFLYIRN